MGQSQHPYSSLLRFFFFFLPALEGKRFEWLHSPCALNREAEQCHGFVVASVMHLKSLSKGGPLGHHQQQAEFNRQRCFCCSLLVLCLEQISKLLAPKKATKTQPWKKA